MTLPKKAKLEKILPEGVAIYDVSDILPKPKRPRSNRRPMGTEIIRIFFHHSGAYGKDGFEGAENSVNFVIKDRNFGARPYHYWLAYKPDLDKDGNMVIYRLAKDEERAWHTGKLANDNGIGVVWQGNLHPDHDGKPSDSQYKMAEALTIWLLEKHGLLLPDSLSFHAEAKKWGANKNKPTCPGPFVQAWVEECRTPDKNLQPNTTAEARNVVVEEKPTRMQSENLSDVLPTKLPIKEKNLKTKKPTLPKKSWLKKVTNAWTNNLLFRKKH